MLDSVLKMFESIIYNDSMNGFWQFCAENFYALFVVPLIFIIFLFILSLKKFKHSVYPIYMDLFSVFVCLDMSFIVFIQFFMPYKYYEYMPNIAKYTFDFNTFSFKLYEPKPIQMGIKIFACSCILVMFNCGILFFISFFKNLHKHLKKSKKTSDKPDNITDVKNNEEKINEELVSVEQKEVKTKKFKNVLVLLKKIIKKVFDSAIGAIIEMGVVYILNLIFKFV